MLEARLARLEGAPSPLAEVSDRLASLYAQKDAAVEAALGRLAPLRPSSPRWRRRWRRAIRAGRWSGSATGWRRRGRRRTRWPATLGDRLSALEGAPSPLAEVSDRLASLYAQKDAAVEAALGRLAPLEAKLSEVEASLAARDPRGALERFGDRLEAARAAQDAWPRRSATG